MDSKLEQLRETNKYWANPSFRYKGLLRRDYVDRIISRPSRLVTILIGARRVGKTSIIQMLINKLLDTGVNGKDILYISGDSRKVGELGLEEILGVFVNKDGQRKHKNLHVFIDEIQELSNWQQTVKYYYDNFNVKLYFTGSSSLILSHKTSKLTGRFLLHEVFPLDFTEYLDFKGKKLTNSPKTNQLLAEEYLRTGGYPEYVLGDNDDQLRFTITSTLYRDLLSYYGLRNPALLEELLNYLADKVTTPVSALTIKKDLKVDEKTARFYIQYLKDVYLIYPLFKEGRSHRIYKSSNPKYYFNDTGVLNLFSLSPRIGALAENAVYLELKRRSKWIERPRIYYTQDLNNEIDFLYNGIMLEVKYRENLQEKELERLNELGGSMHIIVPKVPSKVIGKRYCKLEFIELWKFLAHDE